MDQKWAKNGAEFLGCDQKLYKVFAIIDLEKIQKPQKVDATLRVFGTLQV